jgi:hypothetical protein
MILKPKNLIAILRIVHDYRMLNENIVKNYTLLLY